MAASNPPSDNVFVGDLPAAITKEQFEAIMNAYGSVTSVRVMPPKSASGKASGLVRFQSVEEAKWVVENLNGNLAEGLQEPVQCRFANAHGSGGSWGGAGKGAGLFGHYMPPGKGQAKGSGVNPVRGDNVFVGDLPGAMTQEQFETIFAQYGTVVSCKVLPPKGAGGKASALVRFSSVEEAEWVVQNIDGNLPEGLEEPVKVRFANAPGSGGKGGASYGAQWPAVGGSARVVPYLQPGAPGRPTKGLGKAFGKSLGKAGFHALYGAVKKAGLLGNTGHVPEDCQVFVKNLPADTTDLDLFRLFSPFGALAPAGVKAMLHEDGTCKGFGFADFADPAHAAEACNTLNNFQLPDGTLLGVSAKQPKKGKGAGKAEA